MLLARYIRKFPNAFNLKTISILIKFISNKIKFEQAAIGHGEINEEIRKAKSYAIGNLKESLSEAHWHNFLNSEIINHMNFYLAENNMIKDVGHMSNIETAFLKYEKTYHYKFHVDASRLHNRIVSSVLFLNNDYEGGELCFKNTFDNEVLEIKPEPGMLIVWPSNLLFPHAVKPVTKGLRYTVVSWAS